MSTPSISSMPAIPIVFLSDIRREYPDFQIGEHPQVMIINDTLQKLPTEETKNQVVEEEPPNFTKKLKTTQANSDNLDADFWSDMKELKNSQVPEDWMLPWTAGKSKITYYTKKKYRCIFGLVSNSRLVIFDWKDNSNDKPVVLGQLINSNNKMIFNKHIPAHHKRQKEISYELFCKNGMRKNHSLFGNVQNDILIEVTN